MEDDYGYVGEIQMDAVFPQGPKLKIGDYALIDVENYQEVCDAIEVTPLVAAVLNSPAFQLHKGEEIFVNYVIPEKRLDSGYVESSREDVQIHFVILFGYGDGYYLYQDSRGLSSGKMGYGKISPGEILAAAQSQGPYTLIL